MEQLAQHIESLIFTSDQPITYDEIKSVLETSFETKFKKEIIEDALIGIKEKYQEPNYAFEIVEIANGYQFLTKGSYHNTVGTYLKQTTKKRLSRAALETLSIIAYKQPVSRSEMEKIRGVSCDYSIQKLLEKELISMVGRSEGPGRPLLYGTSEKFMDYFGLKSLEELPKLKDFKQPDTEVGEMAPIEEEYGHDEDGRPIIKKALTIYQQAADNISAIIGILNNEEDVVIEEPAVEEVEEAIIKTEEVVPNESEKVTIEEETIQKKGETIVASVPLSQEVEESDVVEKIEILSQEEE